ncbi:hypothetical protein [Pseudomonas sp. S36]|uniref:hypothetical protein n=1 Tax=Pseudomonas sp. S36 TaxID=2767447 RepID=UPI001911311A|nr:hypothetical protein [Pseudomonas sp. S36]MBK4991365.1 hypothetical protein [Pseudomonas sp. S36]
MAKIFEDHLSEIQADMVSIALEYVEHRADEIYIYAANEDGITAFDVLYKINGIAVEKENINSALKAGEPKYDTSVNRMNSMLDIGLDDLEALEEKCNEFNQEIPSEMLIHYVVESNKMRAKIRYEKIFSEDPELTPGNIFDSWAQNIIQGNPAF